MEKIKYELIVVDSEADWFESTEEYLESREKVVHMKFSDIESLRKWWEILLMDYEGMNYCVYNSEIQDIMVSGTYDPNDIESLFDNEADIHYLYSYPLEINEGSNAEASSEIQETNLSVSDRRINTAVLRQSAAAVIDVFDEFLVTRGIRISCQDPREEKERNSADNSAAVYGMEYYCLEDCIVRILSASVPNQKKVLLLAASNTDEEIIASSYEDEQMAYNAMLTDYRRVIDIIGENCECDISERSASVFGTLSSDLYYWNIAVL